MQGVLASTNTNSSTRSGEVKGRGEGLTREGTTGSILEGLGEGLGLDEVCKTLPAEGTACAKAQRWEGPQPIN